MCLSRCFSSFFVDFAFICAHFSLSQTRCLLELKFVNTIKNTTSARSFRNIACCFHCFVRCFAVDEKPTAAATNRLRTNEWRQWSSNKFYVNAPGKRALYKFTRSSIDTFCILRFLCVRVLSSWHKRCTRNHVGRRQLKIIDNKMYHKHICTCRIASKRDEQIFVVFIYSKRLKTIIFGLLFLSNLLFRSMQFAYF